MNVRDWMKATETKMDRYAKSCYWQTILLGSLEKVTRSLQLRAERMEQILFSPACEAWLMRHSRLDGKLQNRYAKTLLHIERRLKDHARLSMCQKSWMGFKPKCCNGRALAVPIGCNHRLCFLCNAKRAEKYRDRVRVLFDRLTHPAFLTLTVPNIPLGSLRKRVYSDFRKRVNKLRKAYSGYMKGGILGIETTFNNEPESSSFRSWHVHAHILIDGATALPLCRCPEKIRDQRTGKMRRKHHAKCAFTRFKRRIEFDWLCLTQGDKSRDRWRPADFDYWLSRTFPANWRDSTARDKWNRSHRRLVDIRRVKNRKSAAFEVLKYATKAAYFIDVPEAVNEFIDATKGARMLQTFGTWYGFKFDDDVNTWAHLECGCGCNEFERIGVFYREGVESDATGKWLIKEIVLARSSGPPGQT
jgi:uncharacterized protein YecT (DUF1311 family)